MAEIEDSTSSVTLAKFSAIGTYNFSLSVGNEMGANSTQFTINVFMPSATTDLAFMKPAHCSGIESSFTSPDLAVDGDNKTRWSSDFKDGAWWKIDLQHQVTPNSIGIVWEGAYAKSFNVQISADNKKWQTFYSNPTFEGGTSVIPNAASLSGRFLKVNCVTRATEYGSSFYTFNTNGTFTSSTNHVPVANVGKNILAVNEITLNGNLSSDADKDALTYKWEQVAGPSLDLKNATTSVMTASSLKAGDYYFKLTVDDGKDVDFDIVKVICNP
jgi:hypothetical protein